MAGEKNRYKFEPFLQKMDDARKEGIEVTFDQYPYATGSTVLHNILPDWMHSGGTEKMLERLKDPRMRNQIKQGIAEKDVTIIKVLQQLMLDSRQWQRTVLSNLF